MRFVWGLIWVGVGFIIIKYSFPLVNIFGHIPWAERHLGGAGTYTVYKIAGVIVIIFALLYMFGILEGLISPITPYFGGTK
jgi:hypothetical protein